MAFKFLSFFALVAVASAGVVPVGYSAPLTYAAPVATKVLAAPVVHKTVVADEYDPNPQYSFSYGISDALTGDQKEQHESRNGDAVQGSYSLVDADGFKRTVEYTADPIHGFNAVVHREPLAVKTVTPVHKVVAAAPVAYAAPVHKVVAAAPLAYAAPVTKYVAQPTVYAAPALTKTVVAHQPAFGAYAYHH
ncbi:AAEL009796-PA [Aedes aegypti]|uniref:AAEL009796-PA n=2 Tax=Aedes aegypti TaxID=7159 RepID=A0A1S4FNS6_AEDAE|nr:larval cuticle protein A2B [Aedes aegypti]EAT38293.1 AAEL009796-PA [Aedes aegypti]